jgi:hypothetical protein
MADSDTFAKLDPKIRVTLASASEDERRARITVLVKLTVGGDPAPLAQFGFTAGGKFGDVVAGTVPLGEIERLASSNLVTYVEAARSIGYD